MDDQQIIQLYWDRHEQAIDETRSKYGHFLYSVAHNILRDDGDSEESVNDTYLGAWNAIPPTRPGHLSSFLAKITRNVSIMKLRAKNSGKRGGGEVFVSLQELEDCIPAARSFDDELETRQLAELLNTFLWLLPAKERRVFVCRYWGCDSIQTIGRQYGFSQSKVKMMLLRTRNKLRAFLEKEGVFV